MVQRKNPDLRKLSCPDGFAPANLSNRMSPQIPTRLRLATVHDHVRSTLECGGSTPPWSLSRVIFKGGVEPPHSKVLRTSILIAGIEAKEKTHAFSAAISMCSVLILLL